MKKNTTYLIAIILCAITGAVLFTIPNLIRLASIVPGPEGVRALNFGYSFANGEIYAASSLDTLPDNFVWGSNQPSASSLKHIKKGFEPSGGWFINGPQWWYDHDSGEVLTEIQHPILQSDPIGCPAQQLQYYKYQKVSDTQVQITKIIVSLIPADFIVQMSVVPGKGTFTFMDVNNWFALDTVTWMNAYANQPPEDPNPLTNDTTKYLSSNYRGAFPIIAWIGKYQDTTFDNNVGGTYNFVDQNAQQKIQLTPNLDGRFIDLYTSASNTYDLLLQQDVVTDPTWIAQALSPNNINYLTPDPRFSETVYFKISMTSFGAYVQPTGILGSYSSTTTWYPAVYYRLRVVYAIAGEYVYLWTASNAAAVGYTSDTWEVRNGTALEQISPMDAFFREIGQLLSNPFFWLGMIFVGLLIIVVVLAVFAPGVLIAIAGTRKRR